MAKNTDTSEYLPVSLTEEMIMNYAALPKEFHGWRYYRIEYGGHAECCIREMPIFLPMFADAYLIDLLFEFWQEDSAPKMAVKAAEIMAILKEQIRRRAETCR